jgi:Integrase core domain
MDPGITGKRHQNQYGWSRPGIGQYPFDKLRTGFVERLWRSVKYEDIYPKNYASMPELLLGLAEYFVFYNGERYHQALGYKTPNQVYLTGEGGGARIVDYYSD